MTRVQAHLILAVMFLLLAFFTEAAAAGEDACASVAQSLKQTKAQLKEYLEALQKLHNEKDARLLELLNHKINDLSDRVRELEAEFAGCPNAKVDEGLTTVKSDEDQYATKSCPELSKMLLQLLRKTAALKRRERSLFSDLTAAERAELQQWNEELRIVKSVLKNRCSEPAKPASQSKSKNPFKP